jgi:hypothetical protein
MGLPSLDDIWVLEGAVHAHYYLLGAGVGVPAILAASMKAIHWAGRKFGWLSRPAKTAAGSLARTASWYGARSWIIGVCIFLASIIVALSQAYLEVAGPPNIQYGDPTVYPVRGSGERTNILIPVQIKTRLPHATPQVTSFKKTGVECQPGAIDQINICLGFPVDVYWNGTSSCNKSALGSNTFVPFVIVDHETRLIFISCNSLFDLDSLKKLIPPGDYSFEVSVDDDSLSSRVSQRYSFSWTGKAGGFAIKKEEGRP